jgi:hypothetical protein
MLALANQTLLKLERLVLGFKIAPGAETNTSFANRQ